VKNVPLFHLFTDLSAAETISSTKEKRSPGDLSLTVLARSVFLCEGEGVGCVDELSETETKMYS